MQNWSHLLPNSNNGTTTTMWQQKQNSSSNNNKDEDNKTILSFSSKNTTSSRKGPAAMDVMQSILVSKLNGLSIEERDSGLHDLHGVAEKAKEESLEMLQAKIQEMDRILDTDDDDDVEYDDNDVEYDLTDDHLFTIKIVKGHEKNMKEYAYRKAKRINQEYVDQMKVTCLRAESYDAERAAQLLIRFFHRKLQLFGLTCLGREITQQDLIDYNPDAEDLLRKGMAALLPYRDRAGRAILFLDGHVNGECASTDLVMRVVFYMCLVSLRDLETQREGLVLIFYGVDQNKGYDGRSPQFWNNWYATPFRNVAFHMCMGYNSFLHLPGLTFIYNQFQSQLACRGRLHQGSHMECVYNLLTFGIPKDALPVSTDGSRDWTSHHAMLDTIKRREEYLYSNNNIPEKPSSSSSSQQQRQRQNTAAIRRHISNAVELIAEPTSTSSSSSLQQDNTSNVAPIIEDTSSLMMMPLPTESFYDNNNNTFGDYNQEGNTFGDYNQEGNTVGDDNQEKVEVEELVLIPNPKDILLGKGRLPKSHQGNLRFHNLLQEYREEYDSSLKREKTAVSQRLLQQLKSTGCRFLLPDKNRGGYTVVNDQVSREKISHGFRNLRILEERNKGLSSSSSSKTKPKKKTTRKTKSSTVLDTTITYDEESGCSDISDRSQFGRNKRQKNIDQ